MTNKQPIVSKRQTLEEILNKCDNPDLWTPTQIICFISDYLDGSIGKELPEDNQTDRVAKMKNLAQDGGQHNSDLKVWLKAHPDYIETNKESTPTLSKEVLEAMEELRGILQKATLSNIYYHEQYKDMKELAQNLLNALDNQFNHKARDKEVCLSGGDINQQNSLLDRVERLERIIGDKNG